MRNLQAARAGYERLLAEPSFLPNGIEAVWTQAEDRSVYVAEHADGAGNSVVILFLDAYDAHLAGSRLAHSSPTSVSPTPTA